MSRDNQNKASKEEGLIRKPVEPALENIVQNVASAQQGAGGTQSQPSPAYASPANQNNYAEMYKIACKVYAEELKTLFAHTALAGIPDPNNPDSVRAIFPILHLQIYTDSANDSKQEIKTTHSVLPRHIVAEMFGTEEQELPDDKELTEIVKNVDKIAIDELSVFYLSAPILALAAEPIARPLLAAAYAEAQQKGFKPQTHRETGKWLNHDHAERYIIGITLPAIYITQTAKKYDVPKPEYTAALKALGEAKKNLLTR